jgi:hypothetical protein
LCKRSGRSCKDEHGLDKKDQEQDTIPNSKTETKQRQVKGKTGARQSQRPEHQMIRLKTNCLRMRKSVKDKIKIDSVRQGTMTQARTQT